LMREIAPMTFDKKSETIWVVNNLALGTCECQIFLLYSGYKGDE
jgi:hypothetical protein